jgi:hypothetical protein
VLLIDRAMAKAAQACLEWQEHDFADCLFVALRSIGLEGTEEDKHFKDHNA